MLDLSWTDERVELLKTRWEQGIPAREIGGELGVSRNAILGKADRMNLTPRRVGNIQPRRQKLTRMVLPSGGRGLTRAERMQKKRIDRIGWEKFPVPEPTVITEEHKCLHADLQNNSCRYPLWHDDMPFSEKFFCGIPEANMLDGRPWCRHHRLVVYRPTNEMNTRHLHDC